MWPYSYSNVQFNVPHGVIPGSPGYMPGYMPGYTPSYTPSYMIPNQAEFLIALQKAIQGEYEAIVTYEALAKMAPTSSARDIILQIRADEIDHFETFRRIYVQLTGMEPQLNAVGKVANYPSGLEASLIDELNTSEFYQQIYLMTPDAMIRNVFLHAMNDETRHAIWFQYLLFKLIRN